MDHKHTQNEPSPPLPMLDAAALCLRANQPAWAAAGVHARLQALTSFAQAIARHRTDILAALIADTGRRPASEAEVDACSALVARWAALAPALLAETPLTPARLPDIHTATQRVPYSLVGVIAPLNSPLGLALIDAIPALVAGAAVLIKPSEITPRFVVPLQKALAEVPQVAAVIGLLHGDGTIGAGIVDRCDAVCFTGSVATGRRVAAAAAARLIPAFLELGGKDPAIVLDGANLHRAARGISWSGTYNSGQLCHSIERVYVVASVADAFVPLLVAAMRDRSLARPGPDDGALGPFIDPAQADIVEAQLIDAYAKGARALCGGTLVRNDNRVWCPATVLVDVDHGMTIMQAETFAPILPVMIVDDAEAALAHANSSEYGLSASIWGDEPQALALARRLHAGAVSINDASLAAILMDHEKHAFGVSGLGGSRMGAAAVLRFTRSKAMLVNRQMDDSPWW